MKLEGQPGWRKRLLFAITKHGLVPPHAPANYASDMPAFAGTLSDDEIWAVLAYLKSRWPPELLPVRAEMLRNAR